MLYLISLGLLLIALIQFKIAKYKSSTDGIPNAIAGIILIAATIVILIVALTLTLSGK
jgi:hypothetical protein